MFPSYTFLGQTNFLENNVMWEGLTGGNYCTLHIHEIFSLEKMYMHQFATQSDTQFFDLKTCIDPR